MKKMKLKAVKWGLLLFGLVFIVVSLLLTIQLFTSKHLEYPGVLIILALSCYLMTFGVIAGLRQALKLVQLIQRNQPFTIKTMPIVNRIKKLIQLISFASLGILPFFYKVSQIEDAPGLMLLGISLTLLPFAAWAFAELVVELFERAISLQNEQDFTI